MKNFLASMLGALAALVIFAAGVGVAFFGFLGIIAAMGGRDKTPSVERGAYVVVDLSTNITDAPAHFDFETFGDRGKSLQLRTVTRTLRAAAGDARIAGVFLKGSVTPFQFGSGYAALMEMRVALAAVRAAGKPVKAYLNYATTRDLYLASVASDVAIDPYGMIIMPGLASEPVFFSGALEKYGFNVQVTRVGKYKSYVEPFTRKDMSPENREQIQKLLDDIWGSLVADIAQGRRVTSAKVQAVVDAEGIIRPEAALAAKLVDRIQYRDEVIDELKKLTGRSGSRQSFKQISLVDYARIAGEPALVVERRADTGRASLMSRGGHLALVYAEGEIVDGEGEGTNVGGAKFAAELRRLRQDSEVKAIVLRVNSPGGSASAAEAIQREIRLARKVKPVVVSMGTYAASGGYWISAYGDRIFAEPTTITGSIGVFGIQFDVEKFANNHGITFDNAKTGKFAGMLTIARPKTEAELAVFQRLVDWIYGEFVSKVAEARALRKEFVEEIAQGRIWSGQEAKKLGLVDEIGGLEAALAYAAKKSGLGENYRLSEYPRKKQFAEAIGELWEKINPSSSHAHGGVVGQVIERIESELKILESFNDPAGLYARLPLDLVIR
ncbi:MAG: signal peptide peptidase SppA [Opitutaceae bacterium]|nr:signal peptide peptidase SppA [Opitutaceae bacterium]